MSKFQFDVVMVIMRVLGYLLLLGCVLWNAWRARKLSLALDTERTRVIDYRKENKRVEYELERTTRERDNAVSEIQKLIMGNSDYAGRMRQAFDCTPAWKGKTIKFCLDYRIPLDVTIPLEDIRPRYTRSKSFNMLEGKILAIDDDKDMVVIELSEQHAGPYGCEVIFLPQKMVSLLARALDVKVEKKPIEIMDRKEKEERITTQIKTEDAAEKVEERK